jgi:hypothetical protein
VQNDDPILHKTPVNVGLPQKILNKVHIFFFDTWGFKSNDDPILHKTGVSAEGLFCAQITLHKMHLARSSPEIVGFF